MHTVFILIAAFYSLVALVEKNNSAHYLQKVKWLIEKNLVKGGKNPTNLFASLQNVWTFLSCRNKRGEAKPTSHLNEVLIRANLSV